MNCSSCGAETNGIKLNGKTYCPICGEAIVQASPTEALLQITETVPKSKIINDNSVVSEINALKAEEEVLDLIENAPTTEVNPNPIPVSPETAQESAELPESKMTIGKSNRLRIGHKPKQEEPLDEPARKQEPVETTTKELEEDTQYPLLNRNDIQDIQKRREIKKEALTGFLKSKAKNASTKPKKKKKNKKLRGLIMAIALILAVGIGLLFYVNLFVMNPSKSKEMVSESVSFKLVEPNDIPFGYKFAYLEKINDQKVAYHYIYVTNPNNKITVTEQSDKEDKDVYNEYVRNIAGAYIEFKQSGIDYWYINDRILVFKNNLLYQIESSVTMSREELLKIAEGLIENKDLSG